MIDPQCNGIPVLQIHPDIVDHIYCSNMGENSWFSFFSYQKLYKASNIVHTRRGNCSEQMWIKFSFKDLFTSCCLWVCVFFPCYKLWRRDRALPRNDSEVAKYSGFWKTELWLSLWRTVKTAARKWKATKRNGGFKKTSCGSPANCKIEGIGVSIILPISLSIYARKWKEESTYRKSESRVQSICFLLTSCQYIVLKQFFSSWNIFFSKNLSKNPVGKDSLEGHCSYVLPRLDSRYWWLLSSS